MSNTSKVQDYIDEQGRMKASALAVATMDEMSGLSELTKPIRTTIGFFRPTFYEHFKKVFNGEDSTLWALYYKLCGGATRSLEIEMEDGTIKTIPAWSTTPTVSFIDGTGHGINARLQLNDAVKKQQPLLGTDLEDKLINDLGGVVKSANNSDNFFIAINDIYNFDKESGVTDTVEQPVPDEYDHLNYQY